MRARARNPLRKLVIIVMKLAGKGEGKCMQEVRIPKGEMVRERTPQRPWSTREVCTTAISSFAEDGGVLTRLQTLETRCWGLGSGAPREHHRRRHTTLADTLPGLLGVGATRVLQPFLEEVFIFL